MLKVAVIAGLVLLVTVFFIPFWVTTLIVGFGVGIPVGRKTLFGRRKMAMQRY